MAVVGLGFGDEGKGVTVDRMCVSEKPDLVVRFNGGYQAAHHVQPIAGGPVHCFSQFCSGTLAGVPGHLSRYVAIEPVAMRNEAMMLQGFGITDPYSMLTADTFALVVTPYHRWMNQQDEAARGDQRHGSCGLGIWEAVSHQRAHPDEAIQLAHLKSQDKNLVWHRMEKIRSRLEDERGLVAPKGYAITRRWVDHWIDCARPIRAAMDEAVIGMADSVIYEGAQGVLLDENFGFHPHTSASTSTFANAIALAGPGLRKIGVVRSHMTRHGAGPMPTEDPSMPLPVGECNATGEWQGRFRIGAFDEALFRYALDVCYGVDEIVVTHLDYPEIRVANGPWTLGLPKDLAGQETLTRLVSSRTFSGAGSLCIPCSAKELVERLRGYAEVREGGHGSARNEAQRTTWRQRV